MVGGDVDYARINAGLEIVYEWKDVIYFNKKNLVSFSLKKDRWIFIR